MIVRIIKYKKLTIAQVDDMLGGDKQLYKHIYSNAWTTKYLKRVGEVIGEDLTMYATR